MLSRWWGLKLRAKRKSFESKSRPYSNYSKQKQDGPFDQKVPRVALRRQTPQAHFKGHQGGGGRGGSD
jgi:hypothetical protein